MQQTICREVKNCFIYSLLLNTKNISNTLYSFLVRILIILTNPQITKAQSFHFKSIIIISLYLTKLVFTLNILLYAVYYYVNNELLLVMLGIIYIGLSLKAVISDLIIIRLPPLPPIPQLMDVESDDSVNFKSKIIISF